MGSRLTIYSFRSLAVSDGMNSWLDWACKESEGLEKTKQPKKGSASTGSLPFVMSEGKKSTLPMATLV